jgi:hypothetical protein
VEQPRNPYLCLTIVAMLGACAALCIAGEILCAVRGVTTPGTLQLLASVCIGSLSSFLVAVPRGSTGFTDDRKRLPQ